MGQLVHSTYKNPTFLGPKNEVNLNTASTYTL